MKHLFTGFLIAMSPLLVTAHSIDFDKIEHWTGTGPNRAALVVQFGGEYTPSEAYVWGYRWEDEESPNGEDMFKAICENSDELVILTQYTGQYGSTLCGVGFGEADAILDNVYFDFEMALDYPFITFDYYHNNPHSLSSSHSHMPDNHNRNNPEGVEYNVSFWLDQSLIA